ncbi:hypothetical protein BDK51DRAFT_49362 [Blyttiomyces helicus]|uniref:Uncharacterized protein n=1 Tax=Blyttiomyces helicus TaxID=388810 RepID=A0A4P9VUF5_9FUNG|nr:hypothetical protein BDK51DRAFT_49362 [Blyttiomyces helicus]|eukprot:RKO83221.1 hypothetical protein BDK51DRAFT_49362 [Blyttiomyces helicus]
MSEYNHSPHPPRGETIVMSQQNADQRNIAFPAPVYRGAARHPHPPRTHNISMNINLSAPSALFAKAILFVLIVVRADAVCVDRARQTKWPHSSALFGSQLNNYDSGGCNTAIAFGSIGLISAIALGGYVCHAVYKRLAIAETIRQVLSVVSRYGHRSRGAKVAVRRCA